MVKITYDSQENKVTAEPAEKAEVVHFTPRIILRMEERGQNWTLRAEPRNA